ncbi:MAG: MFS transporter [Actinomycetia bacterium]|nr:MFS transporter [Actinomycetes bacterium]
MSSPTRPARAPIPKGFWTIWTTVALDLVGFGIVVPILAVYAERFGASGLTVGLLFAAFSAAQFVCAPLLGRLSDRVGRKPVIVISLLGTAVGSFVCGAAGTLWLLFVGRIIDGGSGASLSVAQAAVGDMASPAERPRLMGLLGAAFGVGFVIGPAVGGLSTLGGPHVPFYVAGTIALINAVAAMVRLPETRAAVDEAGAVESAAAPRRGRRRAITPALRQLAIVGFVTTVAFTAFESTFGLLGRHRFGFGERGSAFVFLGIGILLVVIQGVLYGRAATRFGVNALYISGIALLVVGLTTMAFAYVWPVLIVACVLLTFGQGVASPSISSLVSEIAPPARRGEAMGYQQASYAVGRIVGPPVAGLMFDHAGIWTPYAGAAGLCVIAVILVLKWGVHHGQLVAGVPAASA